MRKLTKLVALVICLCMFVMLFAACDAVKEDTTNGTTQKEDTANGTTNEENAVDNEKGSGDEVMELSIAMNPGSGPMPNDAKYLKIMGEKFNFKFDIWPCYGDQYSEMVNIRLASGERPDILYAGDLKVLDLIEQEIIRDIPVDMMKAHMPMFWEECHKISDNPFIFTTFDNKLYGLTGQYAEGDYHYVPVIRDDWLNNVGIGKKPETLDELEAALYSFVNDDPDKNNKDDTYGLADRGLPFVFGAFGGLPYDQIDEYEIFSPVNDKIVHFATEPEMKEALKMLNKWYNDKVLDPEFITGEHTDGHWSFSQAFFKGRIGFSTCTMFYYLDSAEEMNRGRDGRFYVAFNEAQAQKGNEDASYTWVKPPVGNSGKSAAPRWGALGSDNATCFGKHLEKDEEKMKRAMEWLDEIWCTLDGYGTMAFGKKNEDWFYNEAEGTVISYASPETKQAYENDALHSIGLGFGLDQSVISMSKKMYRKQFEFADRVAHFTPDYLDLFGNAPLKSLSKYKEDLFKLTLSSYFEMITGKKDVDEYFDEYVQEWYNSGGEEILEEGQAWYDTVVID